MNACNMAWNGQVRWRGGTPCTVGEYRCLQHPGRPLCRCAGTLPANSNRARGRRQHTCWSSTFAVMASAQHMVADGLRNRRCSLAWSAQSSGARIGKKSLLPGEITARTTSDLPSTPWQTARAHTCASMLMTCGASSTIGNGTPSCQNKRAKSESLQSQQMAQQHTAGYAMSVTLMLMTCAGMWCTGS